MDLEILKYVTYNRKSETKDKVRRESPSDKKNLSKGWIKYVAENRESEAIDK
jgi:hypothetical protein